MKNLTILPSRLSLSLLTCLLILIFAPLSQVSAQSCDTCPPPETQSDAWRSGTSVTVNINPYFSQDQRNAIVQAFNNWQNGSGNNTGVTFTFTYNSTPISGANTYQVNTQTPNPPPGGGAAQAETFEFPTSNGGSLERAVTNIDPRVTDLTALTMAMAHEIGHTMGINDCDLCCPGVSVMTAATSYNDTTSGRVDPGPCDTATADQTMGVPVGSGGGGGGGGGDYGGGGGGGGYYCTPYYWCYYTSYDGGDTWQLDEVEYAGCW
jgi:hypothetical protein